MTSPNYNNSSAKYPCVHRSVSLYFRDQQANKDKEYHLQLVEETDGRFNVHYQHGRRGAKLLDKTRFDSPVSAGTARAMFNEILEEKKNKKQYSEVDLTQLASIFLIMRDHQMDSAGIDLCMNRRGTFISLVDYAKQTGAATPKEHTPIFAYASARQAREALQEMGVGDEIENRRVIEGLEQVSYRLAQSGLADMGVFVGYRDEAGQIYQGVPMRYSEATRRRMRP